MEELSSRDLYDEFREYAKLVGDKEKMSAPEEDIKDGEIEYLQNLVFGYLRAMVAYEKGGNHDYQS